jgi:methanogenic corrinoid protein MtbC1
MVDHPMADTAQHSAPSDRSAGPHAALLSDQADTRRRRAVARRIDRIARAIEADVVPRLVARAVPEPLELRPTPEDVERMALLSRADDLAAAIALAEAVRDRGVPVTAVFLHLLAPAARRLGEWWVEDRCSFIDVTLGLMQLQQVLQALSPVLLTDLAPPAEGRRVLLLPAPGEQHTFGLSLVAEFFRRGGWDVTVEPGLEWDEAMTLVRRDWFALVGVSVGTTERVGHLAELIAALRRASCNPDIAVLVGGAPFGSDPTLARRLGADGSATDGEQAVRQAEAIAALLAART